VVGGPRVVAAARNVERAVGIAVVVAAEEDMAAAGEVDGSASPEGASGSA
jgi:hypothetical protein